jgi:hypothetical protein
MVKREKREREEKGSKRKSEGTKPPLISFP